MSPMRRTAQHNGGFSLAEAMIATAVLAVATAGVLLPFTSGAAVRTEGTRITLGAKLAADLMEQILCTAADDIVTEWDGHVESQGNVTDAGGAIFSDPAYAKFSREVACEYWWMPQQDEQAPAQFIRVEVRVQYDGRDIAVIERLVAG